MYVNGEGKTIYTSAVCAAPNSQVVASPPANQPTPGTSTSPAVTGTPPPGWKDVGGGFKKEGFFVWLPIDGVTDDREKSLLIRGAGQIRIFQTICLRRNGSQFIAGQIILPPAVARETPKARQDAFRDLFLEQVGGKLVEEKPVTMGTMAGKEYTASTPTGMARFRVLGTGVQIFLVLFSGTKEQLESKEIVAFFDSFSASRPKPARHSPAAQRLVAHRRRPNRAWCRRRPG